MLMVIAMEITPIIIISNKCVEINVILNNLQSSLWHHVTLDPNLSNWQNGRTCLLCRKQLLGFNLHDLQMMKVVEVNLYGVTGMSPCLFLGTVLLVWMITLRLYKVSTRISAYLILLSIKSHHLFRFHLKHIDKVRYQVVWPSNKAIIFVKQYLFIVIIIAY